VRLHASAATTIMNELANALENCTRPGPSD
jgi:hypothetical protein